MRYLQTVGRKTDGRNSDYYTGQTHLKAQEAE